MAGRTREQEQALSDARWANYVLAEMREALLPLIESKPKCVAAPLEELLAKAEHAARVAQTNAAIANFDPAGRCLTMNQRNGEYHVKTTLPYGYPYSPEFVPQDVATFPASVHGWDEDLRFMEDWEKGTVWA